MVYNLEGRRVRLSPVCDEHATSGGDSESSLVRLRTLGGLSLNAVSYRFRIAVGMIISACVPLD
jgi:hypothetical protein